MCSWTSAILCVIFLNLLGLVQCAPELSAEDSYGIIATEWAIRDTLNNLFSTLKLKVIQRKLKLKQYSKIHNFFASITLRDHDNLKKIAKLTKADNIDNGTQFFITQLNEVLSEDNKSDETTDLVYVQILIEEFIDRLDYLKKINKLHNSKKFDINKAILRYFNNHENEFGNTTYLKEKHITGNDSDNNILDSIESWQLSGRRIFSGIKSNIRKFPFMASVQFFKKFQCGGCIIKSDLVITSGSCLQLAWNNRFFRENPLFLSVQVGSSSYERGGENIPVLAVHFHPSFNPKNLRHNLALMRLTRRIKFTSKSKSKVKKINFDRNPWPLPPNAGSVVIVGWGARTFGTNKVNIGKNKLSYATLDFYPLPECQEIYTKEFVTDRNFCAGFFSKGGGACNHDAGGPGILSGLLTGVISFGSPVCGTRDAPTVFTKLGYYTDWIEEIIEMPIVQGNQPTTPREIDFSTFKLPSFKKTTPFKVTPIVFKDPLKDNRFESLRASNNKHEFKDFLKTMFKKKKQIVKHQNQKEQKDEQEKETDSLLEETAQDVNEEDKFEINQPLRQKPEIRTEEERKPLNKPNSKVNIEMTIESQSQSKENSADEVTTIRPSTVLEIDQPDITSLQNDYKARASSTSPFNQHNDGNEAVNMSQEKDFDQAIENLLDDLNIDYILESKTSSPKDQHQMWASDQLHKHTELNKSKSETDAKNEKFRSVVENEEDQSDAIKNENENKKGDSGKDVSDEGDSFSEKNDEQDVNDDKSMNENEDKKGDGGKDVSEKGESFGEKNNEQDVNDAKIVNENKNKKGDSSKDVSEEGESFSEKNNEQDVNDAKNVNENKNKKGDSGKDMSDEGESFSENNNKQDVNDAKKVNENKNEKGDSGKDVSYEEDKFSEKNNEQDVNDDKGIEITDGSQVANSVEDFSNEKNKPSEEVGLKVDTDDEKKDYETDDESKTNEGFKGFDMSTEVLEQEHSSNSSERVLEMMEYEDLYKLLIKDI